MSKDGPRLALILAGVFAAGIITFVHYSQTAERRVSKGVCPEHLNCVYHAD